MNRILFWPVNKCLPIKQILLNFFSANKPKELLSSNEWAKYTIEYQLTIPIQLSTDIISSVTK
jgi:hypothetical protein